MVLGYCIGDMKIYLRMRVGIMHVGIMHVGINNLCILCGVTYGLCLSVGYKRRQLHAFLFLL